MCRHGGFVHMRLRDQRQVQVVQGTPPVGPVHSAGASSPGVVWRVCEVCVEVCALGEREGKCVHVGGAWRVGVK